MNAHRASHLRQPRNRLLNVRPVQHHQIRQLVDDDDDVRQRLLVHVLKQIIAAIIEQLVELIDISHMVRRQQLQPPFHLANGVPQRIRRQLRLGDDRRKQMRNPLIHSQLNPLRIDQDHPHLFRRGLEQHAHDHRVDRDRFT